MPAPTIKVKELAPLTGIYELREDRRYLILWNKDLIESATVAQLIAVLDSGGIKSCAVPCQEAALAVCEEIRPTTLADLEQADHLGIEAGK